MIEFGKTLRTAREAKGYTVAQLADITKLMPSLIGDLENEDFSRIAAPIYGRGFVKLYCEAVGLDPKPLVGEFMEILNGNRDLTIRERKTADAIPEAAPAPEVQPPAPEVTPAVEVQPPAPEVQPETDPVTPKPVAAVDDFRLEAEVRPAASFAAPAEDESPAAPAADPMPDPFEPPRAEPQQDLFGTMPAENRAPAAPAQTISRYAAPLDDHPRYHVGPSLSSFWRIGALGLAALALFVLILLGVRTLYRATAPAGAKQAEEPAAPVTVAPAASPSAPASAKKTPAPAAPRQQQKIPDVYVD